MIRKLFNGVLKTQYYVLSRNRSSSGPRLILDLEGRLARLGNAQVSLKADLVDLVKAQESLKVDLVKAQESLKGDLVKAQESSELRHEKMQESLKVNMVKTQESIKNFIKPRTGFFQGLGELILVAWKGIVLVLLVTYSTFVFVVVKVSLPFLETNVQTSLQALQEAQSSSMKKGWW